MKIGIIGAGNLGTGLGKRLASKGHQIVISFSKTPEKLAEAVKVIGGNTIPGTVEEAAEFGEIVILATPYIATSEALKSGKKQLEGKIIWDCTNALKPDMSGLAIGTTTSAGEEVQKAVPGAKVIKAIPPFAEVLHSSSTLVNGVKPAVFVCGNDVDAKKKIMNLINDIDAQSVDSGPLSNSRYAEPAGFLLVQLAYALGNGANIGYSFLNQKSRDIKAA